MATTRREVLTMAAAAGLAAPVAAGSQRKGHGTTAPATLHVGFRYGSLSLRTFRLGQDAAFLDTARNG